MRFWIILIALFFIQRVEAQKVIVKTNLPYVATATPNLGVEFALLRSVSLNIDGGYNPIEWRKDRFYKHFLVVPELRYWICQRFTGTFIGVHALYSKYNLDDINRLAHRYEGNAIGAGLSYGYHLYLGKRWGLEFVIGAGFVQLNYKKYASGFCGKYIGEFKRNYWGPTRLAISLAYIL